MTAVEWLIEQFNTFEFMYCDRSRIIDIAKAMERQQIKDSNRITLINYLPNVDSEQYYNETFNNYKK